MENQGRLHEEQVAVDFVDCCFPSKCRANVNLQLWIFSFTVVNLQL